MPGTVVVKKSDSVIVNAKGKLELAVQQNPNCKARQITPRWDLLNVDPVEPLALDIEFQTYKAKDAEKWSNRMSRISLVNSKGDVVYDTYVRYEDEDDLATRANPRFGVTWKDLKISNGAQWIHTVEVNLQKIMAGRIIIGHGMRNDITAIDAEVWKVVDKTIDTQHLYGQVGLGTLVDMYLTGLGFEWHEPTHDAKAAMLLYLLKRPYNGRNAFQEKLVFDEEAFPALGAGPVKKRR